MKKKVLALFVALGVMCGGVPAYAANTDTVPVTEYAEALQNLYTANYVYMLSSTVDSLLFNVATGEITHVNAPLDRNELLTDINFMNSYISLLENINQMITDYHVAAFYSIQPDLNTLISASKTYVEACKRVYNYDKSGYLLVSSTFESIYQSGKKITLSCSQIANVPSEYLANAMQELRNKYE